MKTRDWAEQVARGVEDMAKKKAEPKKPTTKGDLLSTGSTELNLAISDRASGAYPKGSVVLWVGSSTSGKTIFATTTLAEAANDPAFDDYRLIYDDAEKGNRMDIERLFGEKLADRLESPALDDKGAPRHSESIEELYFHIDDAVQEGKPFVYVCDSMDGLTSKEEQAKFAADKKAVRAGRETGGSYGDGKAKKNSANLRKVAAELSKTGSILIIICQSRDLLNTMPFQEKETRAGGRALRFYATVEVWASVGKKIKREVRGKSRTIGHEIMLKLKKNRVTGKTPDARALVYPSYGIDDVGSAVDYLLGEKWWTKKGGKVDAKELEVNLSRDELVKWIETEGKLKEFRKVVSKCWREVQAAMSLDRKPRYS